MIGFQLPLLVLRIGFFSAVACTLALALIPLQGGGGGSDKLQHFVVFYTLGLAALVAWPGWRATALAFVGLLAFGALIELLQPLTGRDRDFGDWVADAVGLAFAAAPVMLWAWSRARPDPLP